MSFLAAVLLLNMEPSDAFICFANLLNKPCQLAFFRVDHPMVSMMFGNTVNSSLQPSPQELKDSYTVLSKKKKQFLD